MLTMLTQQVARLLMLAANFKRTPSSRDHRLARANNSTLRAECRE
jgi:hypothetical protein